MHSYYVFAIEVYKQYVYYGRVAQFPLLVRRRCQQIKAKYRAQFLDHSHDDDGGNDDDDDDLGSDLEGKPEEREKASSDERKVAEGDEKYGGGDSDDDTVLKNAPDGMEAYQKASAWYHVSYSGITNPFIAEARKAEPGHSQPYMLYLSFPWICAYQRLC